VALGGLRSSLDGAIRTDHQRTRQSAQIDQVVPIGPVTRKT